MRMESPTRSQLVTALLTVFAVTALSGLFALQWLFLDSCRDLGGRIASARWTCVLQASSLSALEINAPFLQVEVAAIGVASGLVTWKVLAFLLRRPGSA